jgi:hypothetical protein
VICFHGIGKPADCNDWLLLALQDGSLAEFPPLGVPDGLSFSDLRRPESDAWLMLVSDRII